jgi:AcrR family transcriptional regulator
MINIFTQTLLAKQTMSKEKDLNTEAKIKAAAKLVFHKKGFAATRTRDIAEEAGINLALLNYYFRSKQKLFEIVMFETTFGFMQSMALVFNDEDSSLDEKVSKVVEKYTHKILSEPEVPLFILSELRNDATGFMERLPIADMVMDSHFIHQIEEEMEAGTIKKMNPLHLIVNLMSMIVFPFVGSPIVMKLGGHNKKEFEAFMLERKEEVPIWFRSMFTP